MRNIIVLTFYMVTILTFYAMNLLTISSIVPYTELIVILFTFSFKIWIEKQRKHLPELIKIQKKFIVVYLMVFFQIAINFVITSMLRPLTINDISI